ncbi:hypothetical protein Agub_g7829, partial [Astrephomene gubernaculifera]
VPLSDEALDAALRLLEELIALGSRLAPLLHSSTSPNTATATATTTASSASPAPSSGPASCSSSGELDGPGALLRLHAGWGLRPGLLRLLLGLLSHHGDSMQVLEGLLVVLVDFGPAVQQAIAAVPPAEAAAVAVRLSEVLQESRWYGNDCTTAEGAPSASYGVLQLQQGAWYLLAAALRGITAAVGDGVGTAEAGTANTAAWRAQWRCLGRVLKGLPDLPRPEGCGGYVRACCTAGVRVAELLQLRFDGAAVEREPERHQQRQEQQQGGGRLGGRAAGAGS